MGIAQIDRRLKRLSLKVRPAGSRTFTLEGLCRQYWRQDARGFQMFVKRDCPCFGFFVDSFKREDAERAQRKGAARS